MKLRLLLRVIVPLIGVALVLGMWRTWYVYETAKELFDRNIMAVSIAVARDLASSGGELLSQETLLQLVDASGGEIFYHVYGPDGAYVAGFGYPPRTDLRDIGADIAPRLFDATHLERPVRAVTLGQFVDSSGLEGIATITVWQEQSVRQSFAFRQAAFSVLVITSLVAAVTTFVWFGVNSGLSPLTRLRNAVARRSPEELKPIAQSVPEEVQPLVNTLNKLFKDLQNSIDERDRFIGNAAHQLRNPIAAVQGQAESALSAKTKEEMTRRLHKTLEEARHTSVLAEQLLMLERLRHSPESFKRERFDMASVLLGVATRFGDRAIDRDLDFSFDQEGGEAFILGDPELFGEAFENLLDNAMVHGGPTLSSINLTISIDGDQATILVQDNGRGIPVDDREIVFERFMQLDFGRGSGLGLAISKEIVLAHGGTLCATDGLGGVGAGFKALLPLG